MTSDFRGRVVILDGGYESYAVEEDLIGSAGFALERFMGEDGDTEGKLAFAAGAVGAFVRWTEFDDDAFVRLPELKCLLRYGIGYDNIDIPAATARGVKVCNVQGYASHAVTDHALALIFGCVRGLSMAPRQVCENFVSPPRNDLPEVKDLTLGVVGVGRIGGTLCTRAKGLFARVIACDPYVSPERFAEVGAESVDFETLVREADVISLHCNLTEETRDLIDAEAIANTRRDAVLINTSRGPVVVEEPLLDALNEGRLFAAGLDVFRDEPPTEKQRALIDHERVIATGHYAWFSTVSHETLQRKASENMAAMLNGETPEDCLNP